MTTITYRNMINSLPSRVNTLSFNDKEFSLKEAKKLIPEDAVEVEVTKS